MGHTEQPRNARAAPADGRGRNARIAFAKKILKSAQTTTITTTTPNIALCSTEELKDTPFMGPSGMYQSEY